MPKLNKAFTLEVTPEQFLRQCSVTELHELDILMQSNWVQARMFLKQHINEAFQGIHESKSSKDFRDIAKTLLQSLANTGAEFENEKLAVDLIEETLKKETDASA